MLVACLACGAGEPRPPDIVLISIDTLRADHVGAYGYPKPTTPNLDALAREGVVFENAIADTSWTLPSHASLLTGASSLVHSVIDDTRALAPERETLAERLRAAGYRTEAIVSAPYLHPIFGFAQGFDRYRLLGETLYDAGDAKLEQMLDDAWRARRQRDDDAWRRARRAHEVVALAREPLASERTAPLFLFVHIFDVHADYDPPAGYAERFGDFSTAVAGDDPPIVRDSQIVRATPQGALARAVARYDGEIAWVDEQLGVLLRAIDELGRRDSTLVVVTSDHGEEFLDHGGSGHRHSLFDEQLRVPLAMRWPSALPAGRRVEAQVRSIDVAPTIEALARIAGGEAEPERDGVDLGPWIRGEREDDIPALSLLVAPGEFRATALRTRRSKVVVRESLGDGDDARTQIQFFDLASDPREERALGHTPEGDAALRSLLARERELRAMAPHGEAADVELDPSLERALRELGYAE